MTLAQLLAALAARGQDAEAARAALSAASPETITVGIAQLEHRVSEIQALPEDQLTVEVVDELETVADQLSQLRAQRDAVAGLAARRQAAFDAANGNPGSDAAQNIPPGSAGLPAMPGDETHGQRQDGTPDPRPTGNQVASEHGGTIAADQRPGTTEGGSTGTGGQAPAVDRTNPTPNPPNPAGPDNPGTHGEPGPPGGSLPTGTQPATQHAPRGALNTFQNHGAVERVSGGVVTATVVAGAEVPGMTAGTQLSDMDQFVEAFTARANSLFGVHGSGSGRFGVARVTFEYPAERVLDGTEAVNDARIRAVTDPRDEALVAAGGLCAPLDVRYDINVIGVTDRPVLNMLARFQVQRGGIQYRAPWDALQMSEGMGIWTMEEDASIGDKTTDELTDSDPHKTCFIAQCEGTLEAVIYSTYLCLEFPNITARFDREWVQAVTRAAQVAWARWAENQLMARLFSASKLVVGRQVLSAVRDILANYDKVISYYRNRHRLSDAVPLHALFPRWLIDLVRTDVARQMNTYDIDTAFAVSQAMIESWFRTRNVNVTWHLDGLDAVTVNGHAIPDQHYGNKVPAAGGLIPNWPDEVDSLLFTEGDWLFLDGGTMDFGLVRDHELNRRNRYQTFTETFEGLAFMGIESLRVVMPLQATGAMTGTVPAATVWTADSTEDAVTPPAGS